MVESPSMTAPCTWDSAPLAFMIGPQSLAGRTWPMTPQQEPKPDAFQWIEHRKNISPVRLTYIHHGYIYDRYKETDVTTAEREFLARYDPQAFERPSVTVDLVLMSVFAGALHVLLLRREQHPAKGKWSLPGGFVQIDESLDDA